MKTQEFVRNYVSETTAKEIKAENEARQTKEKKRCLMTNRKIEDYRVTKELGITVEELNKRRM